MQRMKRFHLFVFGLFLIYSSKSNSQSSPDKDSITHYAQQLIDGIANGDTTAWAKYLDDSCIITSEDGSVKTKEQFIHGILAPPGFMEVKETISNPIFRSNLNTIIFIYTANLSLRLYGQERLNEICQTDTWFKTNTGWKLMSTEALDKPEAPLPQKISRNVITSLIGEYEISNEYGFKIFTRDDKLYSQRYGRTENELKCETDYTYFIGEHPLIRYIFVRDENNKIIQLISRRAGRDIIFPKTD
jgi:uncharacterized protein DUF4440